jgi:hypothetical protein
MIDRQWLETINDEMSRDNVPIHERDVKAVLQWQRETGERKDIFEGYPEVYAFFSGMISRQNPLAEFRGVFFLGGEFWPITFPMTFGAVAIDLGATVDRMRMPPTETRRLKNNLSCRRELASVMGSCLDWIYGFPRVGSSNRLTFADENLGAGDRHLRGAVEALLSAQPSTRSAGMIMSAHALENVLKAFLAHHAGMNDDGARELGHDLRRILKEALKTPNASELAELQGQLTAFPNVIQDRYKQVNYPDMQLWQAYRWAQFGAAAVARSIDPELNMHAVVLKAFAVA